ncbi:NAD(P)H-hydrate dehydratase [Pseudonocardiaceae bacterium YIM PH 21723]|nr:NAD(P)H-hydrate dehydratase [Pseudonocardiaceae bacterium YIM PH 21723]
MRGAWTTERVRAAEDTVMARTKPGELMRRAAFALAAHAAGMLGEHRGRVPGSKVVLLVGAGNNGGDALWAGAFLRKRGAQVTALLLDPERAHEEGLAALRKERGRVIPVSLLGEEITQAVGDADLVIDGIVGLSARGGLRQTAAALVEAADGVPILAVDLPSGVNPDTGEVDGEAVYADETVTFGCRKPGHLLGAGVKHSGTVHVVDIGIGDELGEPDVAALEPAEVGALWPVPGPSDDKYTQGVSGIAAGSTAYPGAAVLSAGAAVAATSGMVRYAGSVADQVVARWPEVVASKSITDAGRVQAWAVGPGIGVGESAHSLLKHVFAAGVPVVLDADAITVLAKQPELLDLRDPEVPLVFTPHDREFIRLFGEIGTDRPAAVREAARKHNAVVLLKGNTTIIADPDGQVLVHNARTAWPATAGSGDVLTGLITALVAAGRPPILAAAAAVLVHHLAAELAAAGAPIGASALLEHIPDAIRTVRAAHSAR